VTKTIAVIGGGPGGLFAARLLKTARPSWTVDVYERNPASAVHGFGVGLGGQVLDGVREADPEVHDDIVAAGMTSASTQSITTGSGTADWSWGGWQSLAISRATLQAVLRERAELAGVQVHFSCPVQLADLAGADVVIAADGAASATRTTLTDHFRPTVRRGRLQTIWLGAAADPPISASMFSIRTDEHGTWAMHAYPYGDGMATIVVEAEPETLRQAGIACAGDQPRDADPYGYQHLSQLFADYLQGAELLTSNSRWFGFDLIRNETWVAGNVALLGDAAHTAHPSIGSGTRMAMEDAVALTGALLEHEDVPKALHAYEQSRKPLVEHLQRAALPSQRWWETVHERLHLNPDRLALAYISRTGFYSLGRFQPRDPALAGRAVAQLGGSPEADVLDAPLRLGTVELPGRVLRRVPAEDGGPGLHLIAVDHTADMTRLTELRAAGVRLLEIATGDCTEDALQAAATLGRGWRDGPGAALLGIVLTVAGPDDPALPAVADRIVACRDAFDGLSVELRLTPDDQDAPGLAFQLADRLRARTGLPTLLWTDFDPDQARTALVSGRVDLIGTGGAHD
jgi:anthraniloyl-CoA monooxygenase